MTKYTRFYMAKSADGLSVNVTDHKYCSSIGVNDSHVVTVEYMMVWDNIKRIERQYLVLTLSDGRVLSVWPNS